MPRITHPDLTRFAAALLRAAGLAEQDARATAEGLADATARGVTSHGITRLPQYVRSISAGEINRTPDVRLIGGRGATALVDADGGYGFRPSVLAVEEAVRLATRYGVGVVGVRASHHFGAAALYTERIARSGMIGIGTSTAKARIAPPGGTRAVLGNNPLSLAVPRPAPDPPIALDIALGQVAIGRLRLAAEAGEPVPAGWGFDRHGRPSTDPREIIDGGLLAPVGGHKGYGLALVLEILAGALTGSPFGLAADPHRHLAGGVGHLFLALDVSALGGPDGFDAHVSDLVAQVRAVPPGEGQPPPRLPGEGSAARAAASLTEGVAVRPRLAEDLDELAGRLAVAGPPWIRE
ncbi:Ldh family oxidoreductase [Micromonospora sp. WMMD1082]|uniref:Ldh family oxidoreductase n=1 Tax=Micromonospora sp. WMMD1082 TaxID=3016104 RepID=UPI002416549E|nr:Ldh family oxidoreductase [Micromonospora sp. WMMD1082]MDG4798363.1 Ldh family oxidoreductase [Micromonospora sp. WMMD1082]